MQPQKAEALSTVLERSNASVLQQVSWTMVCRALIEGSLGCRFSSWAKDQPLPGSGSFSVVLQYGASLFSGELGRFMNHALFPYARPDEIGMNFVHSRVSCIGELNILLTTRYCVQTWEDLQPVWGMAWVRLEPSRYQLKSSAACFCRMCSLAIGGLLKPGEFLGPCSELTYALQLKNRQPGSASAPLTVFSPTF